jgi:hypothetical protein|tara:strand:- start:191 stop:1618 length:1428 start_codon:yes stop_codon:yes gene_type:complete
MSKNHAPSQMRNIRRELKEGANPENLFTKVKSISDPYYRSLSLYLLISYFSPKNKQFNEAISLAGRDIEQVQQTWRRIELLGSISKILKTISNVDTRDVCYSTILEKIRKERDKDVKEFLLKYSKNFPDAFLTDILTLSSKLKGSEVETGKTIIRHGVNMKSTPYLIDDLLKFDSKSRTKLLGYLHLQLFKSSKNKDSNALSKALDNAVNQESLLYLVRVCSTPSDFLLFEEHILDLPAEDKLLLLISLTSRADRKKFSELAKQFYDKSELQYDQLPESSIKNKLRSKLDLTLERLGGIIIPKKIKNVKVLNEIEDNGKHTLALYNTYGGNWNHPHFKSIFKASNLCVAFELDLALINFPEISSEKLIKEIKKEMRLPNEGYIKLLFDKDRVRFFNNEIDENWSGNIVATTASPDQSKVSLPGGRLCMVMGLGPKGLPKSFINKAAYHFELTGSDIAFETGTAMGAISAHLGYSG